MTFEITALFSTRPAKPPPLYAKYVRTILFDNVIFEIVPPVIYPTSAPVLPAPTIFEFVIVRFVIVAPSADPKIPFAPVPLRNIHIFEIVLPFPSSDPVNAGPFAPIGSNPKYPLLLTTISVCVTEL